jgi:ABC-2 type transport system permease protein
MYWTLRKAKALFTRALSVMTEYRAEVIIWILASSLPLIMMMIWMGLAKEGPIGSYSASDFAVYFLSVFFVRQITMVWVAWELEREIRLGELSPKLLRPLDPYWQHVMDNLAEKVIRLPIIFIPIGLGLWLTDARLEFHLLNVTLFLFAVILAWLLRFNRQYCLGLLSFWTDQVIGLEQVWFALYIALSGAILPLDLLPEGLQRIIMFTPFPYKVDFPVQLFLGKLTPEELLRGFGIQLFWVITFVLLRLVLWKRGLKRYGATGA